MKYNSYEIIYFLKNATAYRILSIDYGNNTYVCRPLSKDELITNISFEDDSLLELFVKPDRFYILKHDFGDLEKNSIVYYDGRDLADIHSNFYGILPCELEEHFDRWDVRRHARPGSIVSSMNNKVMEAIYQIDKIDSSGQIHAKFEYNYADKKLHEDIIINSVDYFKNIIPASRIAINVLKRKILENGYVLNSKNKYVPIDNTEELRQLLSDFENKLNSLRIPETHKTIKRCSAKLTKDIQKTLEQIKRKQTLK